MNTYVYETPDGAVLIRVRADDLREAERKVKATLRNTVFHRHVKRLALVHTAKPSGRVHIRSAS